MGLCAAGRTCRAWGRGVSPIQDLVSDLRGCMPRLRGRVIANQPLSEFTWFRVGGAAQVLFVPEDETDLAEFLAALPREIPVTVVGLGSNLIVRDGGVPGAVSRMAQEAAISGLAFFRGIPGAIGGALRMNGGAYGRETKDAVIEVRGIDRDGRMHVFSTGEMNYSYRHCGVPEEIIFTQALFQGEPGNAETIAAEMDKITEARETTQPIKSRTGGSTFKNPPGRKAWQLIDAAGCRGLRLGHAQVSELHCNFLINLGGASAADIENLGESVRTRVKESSGVDLEWEIKRIGVVNETRQ